ncbi:hypothetical protein VZG47_12530 [Synechococcus elongatus IITB5]
MASSTILGCLGPLPSLHACRLDGTRRSGRIAIGARADFVIFNARSFTELLARPKAIA